MVDSVATKRLGVAARAVGKKLVPPGVVQLRLQVRSRLQAIEPVCRQIRRLLVKQHLRQTQFAAEIVARECLNNAITHGNRGDARAWVRVAVRVGRKLIRMDFTDQGQGFNWQKLRRRRPGGGSESGRGLMIVRIYAKRVVFNARGNRVTLWIDKSEEER